MARAISEDFLKDLMNGSLSEIRKIILKGIGIFGRMVRKIKNQITGKVFSLGAHGNRMNERINTISIFLPRNSLT